MESRRMPQEFALRQGGTAMDMIEAGARVVEADGTGLSVGIGGLPDRDGHVTLDACCMNHWQCKIINALSKASFILCLWRAR